MKKATYYKIESLANCHNKTAEVMSINNTKFIYTQLYIFSG
jgi:hypothetical protein